MLASVSACSIEAGQPSPAPEHAAAQQGLTREQVDGYFVTPTTWYLKPGSVASTTWRYTTSTPPSSWMQPSSSPSGWSSGSPGFGTAAQPGDVVRTSWSASDLWLRKTFSISSAAIPTAGFWGRWDDSIEVYINGVLAAKSTGWTSGYRYLGINDAGRAALNGGSSNTLAVHVQNTGGPGYFDLGVTVNPVQDHPVSGFENTPALAAYTDAVLRTMEEQAIPAGVLAVMKEDTVVVSRAFGWADKHFTVPLAQDAVLRHASLDKYPTIGAIQKLISDGTVDPVTGQVITESTLVFPLLAAHGLTPLPGGSAGADINQITVGHLLRHESGIQELTGDEAQLYADLQIAPGTSTPEDNVRWLYSQPTNFVPGTSEEYSSAGMSVLRYLVGVLTGDFLGSLQDELWAITDQLPASAWGL